MFTILKKYSFWMAIAVLALIAAGCSSAANTQSSISTPQTSSIPQTSSSTQQSLGSSSVSQTYTMAQVQSANSRTKCWTVINGSVYDLTNYISRHPGGAANIMQLCGVDGTTKFTSQHGGDARPEQELASLKIGVLAQ